MPSEDVPVDIPPAGGSWTFLRSLMLDSYSHLVSVGKNGFPVHLGISGWYFPFRAFTSQVLKAGRLLQCLKHLTCEIGIFSSQGFWKPVGRRKPFWKLIGRKSLAQAHGT